MVRRLTLAAVVCLLVVVPESVRSQELLTNGGIELVSETFAGRNAVPPGWQMEEGPWVPELPPGPAPVGWPSLTPWPWEGNYNESDPNCDEFLCHAIEAADYTVWRNNLGTNFTLPNRHRASVGPVKQFDYNVWKMNFGGPNTMSLAEPGNFSHLILEGDWHMWFQPYNSNRTEPEVDDGNFEAEHNFAHLYQDVDGTPGLQYTMTGWALFENYFPGGVVNLNAANPDGTGTGAPFNDGELSPTDTFFALEFLDAGGVVLDESVEIELKADGQTSDTVWRQHMLSAMAPAGTEKVRVRASMIDGIENPLPCPQCFQMSFFVDAFSLTAAQPGGGAGGVVPEPASWFLCAIAWSALGVLRSCSLVRR